MPDIDPLFEPHTLGPLRLPHRVVMAPLTRNRAAPGNVPRDLNVAYYRQRASAALILSEATQVTPMGVGYPHTPGMHDENQARGWRAVTDAVHDEGGLIFLQLWHVGRISHPSLLPGGATPVSSSAVKPSEGQAMTYAGMQDYETPRALDADELPRVAQMFANATTLARHSGFDGVEVHAANGYLLDQFLRDGVNKREDAYGGDAAGRCRFPLEVVDAVVDAWSADRVGVRVSPTGTFGDMSDSDPEATFGHFARELDARGTAYLHVVEPGNSDFKRGAGAFTTGAMRPHFSRTLIANGGYTGEQAREVIAKGEADLVSFGRAYIANPDLAERLRRGAGLNEPDPATFYGGDERGYTDYPFLED